MPNWSCFTGHDVEPQTIRPGLFLAERVQTVQMKEWIRNG